VDARRDRGAPALSEPRPFAAFGAAHVGALATVAVLAASLVVLVRRHPALGRPVRLALAAGIAALVIFEFSVGVREGWLGWVAVLPLELCDAALVLAVITLVVPRRATAEVVYFWTVSGSVLAMLTPDLAWDFPRWEFVVFFGLHGLALVAALVLVFGLGLRPRPGAPLRVWAITLAWAAFVGLVDLEFGTNYMYLRRKPPSATPLDWMGPWPVYLAVGAGVAFALFLLVGLPFRRERLADRPSA
jgi:hypothetical integral membrane protein (TIGR02206 family)